MEFLGPECQGHCLNRDALPYPALPFWSIDWQMQIVPSGSPLR
jgi:hypothetical protein